jgi:Transposase
LWVAGGDRRDEAAKDRRCTHNVDLQGEGLVCAVLDDLVTALYVTVDELVEPRRGPGCRPRLSDAELVCLAVAQVLLGYDSERRWLRAVADRLGHLFPYVCGQAAYNRRLRRAAPLVARLLHALAVASPSWCDQWRLLDATPVPCGQSRETVKRSALAGWAGYGWDASHHRFWWGLKLYVLAAPDGRSAARAALDRFYRWVDGVGVAELSRLARTVRAWEGEILAWHATQGCSNGPTEAVNLLIKKVKRVGHGFRNFDNYRLRLLLHCGVTWQTPQTARLRGRSPRRA